MPYCVIVLFYLDKISLSFKVCNDLLSCFKAVKPCVFPTIFIDLCIRSEDVYNLKSGSFSYFKVIWIMSWRHFYNSGSKLHIYIVISYYRYFSIYERNDYFFSDEVLVSWIIRIDCNSSISKHCFRSGSC